MDLAGDAAREQMRNLIEARGAPEIVIHAASRQPGRFSLSDYVKSNVLTTANLLDALAESPPRSIIYTSTISVYGRPENNPVRETEPPHPETPYALTKLWSEQLLEAFKHRAQVIILRLPSLFGLGQKESFIDGLAKTALFNEPIEMFARGEVVRDALYVSDVVRAIESCIMHPPPGGFHVINLGCGRRLTTREYALALVSALGSTSAIVPVDRPSPHFDLYADIEEAARLLGFRPTSLEESMKEYADELRTQS